MNIMNILAFIVAGGLLVWYFFFRGNGKKLVYVEMYQLNGTLLIRLNPKGAAKAYIKKENGVDMLHIPKKYDKDKTGIEIPKAEEYIPNFAGVSLIKIAKINEGEFKLLKHDVEITEDEIKSDYQVLDRDISFWAQNQYDRVENDYKNESTWDKIKPFATLAVVGFICFLMVYSTIKQVNEMATEAAGERKETIDLINKFINREKVNTPQTGEVVETDAAKPPVTSGAGG